MTNENNVATNLCVVRARAEAADVDAEDLADHPRHDDAGLDLPGSARRRRGAAAADRRAAPPSTPRAPCRARRLDAEPLGGRGPVRAARASRGHAWSGVGAL